MKFYAGIGSRSTPISVQKEITILAKELNRLGYCVRSGNADGADEAFAKGVEDDKCQVWLPWKEFNISFQILHKQHQYHVISPNDKEAFQSIDKFHPTPKRLGPYGVKLMARNYRQIIGKDEPNSLFVICWTTDGKEVGGTSQAIRIAKHHNIPVYNMYDFDKEYILEQVTKIN